MYQIVKKLINSESVLFIDRWKSTSNNTKTVITMLKDVLHLLMLITEEKEASDKFTEIVSESIQIAKNLYETIVLTNKSSRFFFLNS